MDDEDTAELQEEVKDLCLSEIGYFIEPIPVLVCHRKYQEEREHSPDVGAFT